MAVDVVSFGETMFRLTTVPGVRLENAAQLQIYIGGTESNTLACLARLNFKTRWLSALPANPMGRRVTSELSAHGVDTSHVVWAQNARLGIFYVEESEQPIGLQVYYDRANSACALVDPDSIDYTLIDDARMLHLTGITPALSERAREVFRRFLDRAHARQIPLSFDVNYRAKLWSPSEAAANIEAACRQASVLICTRADATELWGITGDAETMLRQMARRFAGGGADKTLVLTLGNEGAAQLSGDAYRAEPAFLTTGTMRFGSGDAFAAGYLYACLEGPLYQEMREERGATPLAFGNALAALKRCIAGDIAVIGPDDMKAVLRQDQARFR
jgi:2-dehydro-3-deoxygluconokinase